MQPLKLGSFSTPVRTLQLNLKKLGYGNFMGTGYFGASTLAGVKAFQENNGIPVTGIWTSREEGAMQNELSSINRRKIYNAAIRFLGVDASPNDLAPDEVGCADTVSSVLKYALGKDMGIDYTLATAVLYRELSTSKGYMRVKEPLEGDVLVSPTGYGDGDLSNGHTGIWGKINPKTGKRIIMSNNSLKGVFEENYDEDTWRARYVDIGAFPMASFRKL